MSVTIMSNKISAFELLINKINLRYGLQLPVGAATLIAIVLWIFEPNFFQNGALSIYIVMISVVTLISLIHTTKSQQLSHRQMAYIYACYHVALAVFTIRVAPFLSPFDFLWIGLAIGSDLILRGKSLRITFIVYALSLGASYFATAQVMSLELASRIIVQYLGVVFISIQVSKYRAISDEERSELDTTFKESSFERQRLLSLINNMGEAVVATDNRGRVLLYNAAVLSLLDTNQSLEGKSLSTVLHLKDAKHKNVKFISLLEKSPMGITSTDYIHEFAPNDAINLYLNIAPVKLGFKAKVDSGYIILMRDVTKEKSLEDERDEFISVVSHELRTPVAIAEGNISNALFMSTKNHAPQIVTKSLDQAHEQVLFLASMINDLATLSRAERTDTPLEINTIDLRKFVHDIGRDYEKEALIKKLKFTASASTDVKPLTTADLYLHEIIQNFVTNALKYTKSGTVLLHVRSNKNGDAVFSVADTGIGLSKSDQKRVFDKFFRSEDYRTRESSGTGLGLYVTAKLAHKLNAKITLESQLNKGSTFTIVVPSMKVPVKHSKKILRPLAK